MEDKSPVTQKVISQRMSEHEPLSTRGNGNTQNSSDKPNRNGRPAFGRAPSDDKLLQQAGLASPNRGHGTNSAKNFGTIRNSNVFTTTAKDIMKSDGASKDELQNSIQRRRDSKLESIKSPEITSPPFGAKD